MFNHFAIRRDFHNGTAGLAHTGTVCRPTQNSGFVTLLNYGQGSWLSDRCFTPTYPGEILILLDASGKFNRHLFSLCVASILLTSSV